jgi:protein-disulfide isomerase
MNTYALPITIVVAGALIAGAVFFVGKGNTPAPQNDGQFGATNVRPADGTDHILGNPNAPVKIIEYADLECQYCKQFHVTMHQLMAYYGESGQVAWVFRHFPLAQIHSKAPQEAAAAECAAELGGNSGFWQFVDKLYEVTPSNNGLDLAQLPTIAASVGIDSTAFSQCLQSGRHTAQVQAHYNEALQAGAQGTPYTLVMYDGDALPLQGAQGYDSMRAAVDAVLANVPGVAPTTPRATTTP